MGRALDHSGARLALMRGEGRMIVALPTRHLLGLKPHHYVSAVKTDVRRTFRRARLLAYLQRGQQRGAVYIDPKADGKDCLGSLVAAQNTLPTLP